MRVRGEIDEALRSLSASVVGWITSPIHGADGNVEFLVHARAPEAARMSDPTPQAHP